MHKNFNEEVSTKQKYKSYCEVLDLIIDLHNNYGKNRNAGNWEDWLQIIPINLTVMSKGFLAAIQTNSNKAIIKSYKVILLELSHDVTEKLSELITQSDD